MDRYFTNFTKNHKIPLTVALRIITNMSLILRKVILIVIDEYDGIMKRNTIILIVWPDRSSLIKDNTFTVNLVFYGLNIIHFFWERRPICIADTFSGTYSIDLKPEIGIVSPSLVR